MNKNILFTLTATFILIFTATANAQPAPTGVSGQFETAGQHPCEAVSGGHCYYIDAVYGSDSAAGSESAPWKSLKKIFSFYQAQYRPAGWVALQAGDVVYLKNGIYSDVTHPGTDSGAAFSPNGGPFTLYLRHVNGTSAAPITIKAFPGHKPVLDNNKGGTGIQIHQCSWLKLQGLEIRNTLQNGLWVTESNDIVADSLKVHDIDGVDNDNLAGIHFVDSFNLEVASSTLYDNYDRTNADTNGNATENSSDMVVFRGGNVNVHDSLFYQTPAVTAPKTGACLKYKHASDDPAAAFTVHHNVFKNCRFYAMGVGTANTNFHHNVVIGGYGVQSRDLGGLTHQTNQLFEYNTFYNVQMPFEMIPVINWRNTSFPNDPQNIRFQNNIVIDAASSYNQEAATVNIGTYISDALYDIIKPQLFLQNNCYSGAITPKFNLGAANNGGTYGSKGGAYSLSSWQSLGFDQGSVIDTPSFLNAAGGDFRLQSGSPCSGKGAF